MERHVFIPFLLCRCFIYTHVHAYAPPPPTYTYTLYGVGIVQWSSIGSEIVRSQVRAQPTPLSRVGSVEAEKNCPLYRVSPAFCMHIQGVYKYNYKYTYIDLVHIPLWTHPLRLTWELPQVKWSTHLAP